MRCSARSAAAATSSASATNSDLRSYYLSSCSATATGRAFLATGRRVGSKPAALSLPALADPVSSARRTSSPAELTEEVQITKPLTPGPWPGIGNGRTRYPASAEVRRCPDTRIPAWPEPGRHDPVRTAIEAAVSHPSDGPDPEPPRTVRDGDRGFPPLSHRVISRCHWMASRLRLASVP